MTTNDKALESLAAAILGGDDEQRTIEAFDTVLDIAIVEKEVSFARR